MASYSAHFFFASSALYLDRNSPCYIDGIPEMLKARPFKYWHDFSEALRTASTIRSIAG